MGLRRKTTISAEPDPPNPTELRAQLERDRALLRSLDPKTAEYRRLRRKISQDTEKLRHQVETRDRRATEFGEAGWLFVLIGAAIMIPAWGSWWVLLGIGMLLLGLHWVIHRPSGRAGKDSPPGPGR
ncbi:hypothetical protein [Amycolatopsis nigrescens]|uniref:hypothetical protein n=1 Tax=Amycolatopsis nigrescens TaxID=381445 RepID=UPI0003781B82|nr:hypothetical protein [Amycolatopsis nigrescens]